MKRTKRRIVAAITGLVMATAAMPPLTNLTAAEEYAIRDKWGYCQTANYAESEHFVIFYGNNDTTGQVNDAFLKRNLEAFERLWKCYTEYLGMTGINVDIYGKSQQKYKVNVYLTHTGLSQYPEGWAFMSAEDGYGIHIISPDAMLDDLTIAHEFGHVVHHQQVNWVDQAISGAWWEPMANWFREMYLASPYNPTDVKTGNFDPYLRNMSLSLPHGRNYYETFPFLLYLSYNPDNLPGLGLDAMHKLLSQSNPNEYPLDMITRILGVDAHEVLGHYAKHMAVMDFGESAAYQSRFRTVLQQTPYYWNLFYTVLEPKSGGTYRVPQEDAPMQGGLNIVPLQITGDTITAEFHGLSGDPNAGWQACIVTVDANGKASYSDLFSDGEQMQISANGAVSAYLTVVGTPQKFVRVDAFHKEKDSSYKNGDERRRYPYEVTLSGAQVQQSGGYSKGNGRPHPNGGGFVASSARVDAPVYVGPNAMVLGNAVLTGNVRVEDYAIVEGDVTASDNVTISGHAVVDGGGWVLVNGQWVIGKVTLSGNAAVADGAVVAGGVTMKDNAKALQKAFVADGVTLSGNAVAKGMTYAYGAGNYSGQAILDGDYSNEEALNAGVGFGWLDTADPRYTDGMLSGYDFGKQTTVWSQDRHAATDALLQGSAQWSEERTSAKGVISLDGKDAYVELDSAAIRSDDLQISMGVLWKGGSGDLFFAGDDIASLSLKAANADGVAEFTITDGKTVQKLTANKAIPQNVWNQVTLRLIDGKGELHLNGTPIASGDITLTPTDVLLAAKSEEITLGKGSSGYLKGAYDYCDLYFKSAPEPMIAYSGMEEPDKALRGDVNVDGKFDMVDVVLLQKWLLDAPDTTLADWKAGDFTEDNGLNAFDLSIMKRELLAK